MPHGVDGWCELLTFLYILLKQRKNLVGKQSIWDKSREFNFTDGQKLLFAGIYFFRSEDILNFTDFGKNREIRKMLFQENFFP